MDRHPESLAAREAINAIVAAHISGTASKEAVNWVYDRAFEQFRKECAQRAKEENV